jgi:sugar phosphate isomerase/epimerase
MYHAISTACLYPLETEKSLKTLLDLGFRNFEIFINCQSEFTKEFFDLLKSILAPYNAKVYSVHLFTSGLEPYLFFSNYPRRFNDSLELYKKYFALISSIGAAAATFHGDKKDSLFPIDEFCKNFLTLSKAAENQGIILSQENVSRCRSRSVESVKEMKYYLGKNIHFTLDVKQAIRAGVDPLAMCDAMGENISCVHFSDSNESHDCLLPGEGNFNIKKLVQKLSGYNYNGPLIVEVYSSCIKNFEQIKASGKYLKDTIYSC